MNGVLAWYLFSATFWHLENAEQHVGRFLAHPNVLEAVSKVKFAKYEQNIRHEDTKPGRDHSVFRAFVSL